MRTCKVCNQDKKLTDYKKHQGKQRWSETCLECSTTPRCTECQIIFSSASHLKRHKKAVHLNIKEGKCEYCPFTCSIKSNLKLHSCYQEIERQKRCFVVDKTERYYQKILEKYFRGGQKACDLGQADIVNDELLIEIKDWKNYRDALGQILMYSNYFPKRLRMIIYIGNAPPHAQTIKDICAQNDVLAVDVSEL